MKKLVVCLLGMALIANVSLGINTRFTNTSGDGAWENPVNWELGFLPTNQDNVFANQLNMPTCTVSSSNTINALRINELGQGGVTLHMDNAWLTLRTNSWASLSYNVVGAPSTLIMTNSTILHLADTNTTPGITAQNGHFNVGYYRAPGTYGAGENTSTLIMDNSAIILERGTLRMHPGTPNVTNLAEEIYYDSELNLRTNITTITMNNGSSIDTDHMNNMDNGMIYLNTGSYIVSRRTVEPQLDVLISNGWIVVDGTVVTPENKDQYVYVDMANVRTHVGSFVIPMVTVVPDVVGLPLEDATAVITNAGLAVGILTMNYSAMVELGNVISQHPVGGMLVVTNFPVDLVVSLGVGHYYELTVNSGTGGGWYPNGTQVAIAADASSPWKIFDRWIGDIQHVASVTSSSTTVTMPASNITLTATFISTTNVTITIPSNQYVAVSYAYEPLSTNGNTIDTLFAGLSTGSTVILWDNTSQSWSPYTRTPRGGWGPGGTNQLIRGIGALVTSPTATNLVFSGAIPTNETTAVYKNGYTLIGYPYPADMAFTNMEIAKTALTGEKVLFWTNNSWVVYSKLRTGWQSGVTNLVFQNCQGVFAYLSHTNSAVYEIRP